MSLFLQVISRIFKFFSFTMISVSPPTLKNIHWKRFIHPVLFAIVIGFSGKRSGYIHLHICTLQKQDVLFHAAVQNDI